MEDKERIKQDAGHIGLSRELLSSVDQFIREHYKEEQSAGVKKGHEVWKKAGDEGPSEPERIELHNGIPVLSHVSAGKEPSGKEPAGSRTGKESLDEVLSHVGETFQQRLLYLIKRSGLTDAEVYKRAHVDRKLFSKIRCNVQYKPGKRTVIAFALALRLDIDETTDLLRRAGMALSPGSRADLIIEYCIRNRIYDIDTVNALLDRYKEPILW